MYGVSFDSVEDNAAFAQKYQFPFPLLSDVDRELALALGLVDSNTAGYAPRATFVVSAEGVIEQAIETSSPGSQAAELLR